MADGIVLSASMSAALQNLQTIQAVALGGLNRGAQMDQSMVDLISQSQTLGNTTATRGTVINTTA